KDHQESIDETSLGQQRHAATGLYVKSAGGLRLRHRRVRRLVEKMRRVMPWLEPSDEPVARAWAELEILGAYVFNELMVGGVTNPQGKPRRLLTELRQLRQAQLAYARELGMTPAARIAIKASGTRVALDLAAAMAHAGEIGEDDEGDDEKSNKPMEA